MTDPSKNRYGFSYRGARAGGEQMGMYIYSELGGHLYDKDGVCQFNTPAGIAAFKRYTDLYKKGYSPKDSINWGYPEMVQGFTSGLTGILNQTTEVVAEANKTMKEGTWTVLPFPRAKDGNIYSKADSFVLAIASNSKTPDQAFKLVGYMLKPENNADIAKTNLYIPVMKGSESDPYFTEGLMSGFMRSMNDPHFVRNPYYGYFPEIGEFTESFQDSEVQKYLLDKQSAEQTVKNISDFLTKNQQKFMKEHPEVPIPDSVSIK
jgi:multiple sugar transport system substrate-binding protein